VNNYKFTEEYIVQHLTGNRSINLPASSSVHPAHLLHAQGEKDPASDLDDLPSKVSKVSHNPSSGFWPPSPVGWEGCWGEGLLFNSLSRSNTT